MKTAIVTGASRGIGKEIALELLNDGYAVHGVYVRSDDVAKRLESEHEHLTMHRVDLAKTNQIEDFAKKFGDQGVDVLVNNAGIYEDSESWEDFRLETWNRTMAVNLGAPMLLTNLLQDKFSKGGSIINIVSTDIDYAAFASFSYSASKAG